MLKPAETIKLEVIRAEIRGSEIPSRHVDYNYYLVGQEAVNNGIFEKTEPETTNLRRMDARCSGFFLRLWERNLRAP